MSSICRTGALPSLCGGRNRPVQAYTASFSGAGNDSKNHVAIPCALDDFLDVDEEPGVMLNHDGCEVEEFNLQRIVSLRGKSLLCSLEPKKRLDNLLINKTACRGRTNSHDGKVVAENCGDLKDEVNSWHLLENLYKDRDQKRVELNGSLILSEEHVQRKDRTHTSKGVTNYLFSPLKTSVPKAEKGANYKEGCGLWMGRGVGLRR
ncbi:hypothetical protein BDM02DRAFT_3130880 [Thelephora ganbajun]|uniref:Uncharacterized protein n=1 Tax=Thelephora ganbajun TaxID=370292 RepID=A0ACB6Z803_THEGA|nr:hypothetical protein BDM02DRAFT_3130880 [Thelephora ganbajun]